MATQVEGTPFVLAHPLEPLTPEEIQLASAIVLEEQSLSERVRFVSVTLYEPPKQEVLAFKTGDAVVRRAFIILLDKNTETSATYEAIVNLSAKQVDSWKHIPGPQPSILLEEFLACEQTVKAHPEFKEALENRGLPILDLVYVDPWTAGNYGTEEENTRRMVRTTVHVRLDPDDLHENSYAHPVEGLHVLFDLTTSQVI